VLLTLLTPFQEGAISEAVRDLNLLDVAGCKLSVKKIKKKRSANDL
jgi:hypothetical protein